jgi:N utilization substance protein B
MNRTEQREQAFYLIFENMFKKEDNDEAIAVFSENINEVSDYAKTIFVGVKENCEEIDNIISQFSNGWKIARIPKINLSILRLAIYEMNYVDNVPDSVAINEAVELAKKYSGKEDASFINGILGAYSRCKS